MVRRPRTQGGRFVRPTTRFRNWVTADGSPGPIGRGGFAAEPGRYHLYVSLACPWAHRTLIFRTLKGLEDDDLALGRRSARWARTAGRSARRPAPIPDGVNGTRYLAEIYLLADPRYTGRVTVPVLWDKERETIVNNEFVRDHPHAQQRLRRASATAAATTIRRRCAPRSTRSTRASTRTSTTASIAPASPPRRRPTRRRSARCSRRSTSSRSGSRAQRYLAGDRITEADWRLFTTLIRFDAVYYGHFKCNLRRHRRLSEPVGLSARPLSACPASPRP